MSLASDFSPDPAICALLDQHAEIEAKLAALLPARYGPNIRLELQMLRQKLAALRALAAQHPKISDRIPVLSDFEEARALQYQCECIETACFEHGMYSTNTATASLPSHSSCQASTSTCPASMRHSACLCARRPQVAMKRGSTGTCPNMTPSPELGGCEVSFHPRTAGPVPSSAGTASACTTSTDSQMNKIETSTPGNILHA